MEHSPAEPKVSEEPRASPSAMLGASDESEVDNVDFGQMEISSDDGYGDEAKATADPGLNQEDDSSDSSWLSDELEFDDPIMVAKREKQAKKAAEAAKASGEQADDDGDADDEDEDGYCSPDEDELSEYDPKKSPSYQERKKAQRKRRGKRKQTFVDESDEDQPPPLIPVEELGRDGASGGAVSAAAEGDAAGEVVPDSAAASAPVAPAKKQRGGKRGRPAKAPAKQPRGRPRKPRGGRSKATYRPRSTKPKANEVKGGSFRESSGDENLTVAEVRRIASGVLYDRQSRHPGRPRQTPVLQAQGSRGRSPPRGGSVAATSSGGSRGGSGDAPVSSGVRMSTGLAAAREGEVRADTTRYGASDPLVLLARDAARAPSRGRSRGPPTGGLARGIRRPSSVTPRRPREVSAPSERSVQSRGDSVSGFSEFQAEADLDAFQSAQELVEQRIEAEAVARRRADMDEFEAAILEFNQTQNRLQRNDEEYYSCLDTEDEDDEADDAARREFEFFASFAEESETKQSDGEAKDDEEKVSLDEDDNGDAFFSGAKISSSWYSR